MLRTRDAVLAELNVSRETVQRLDDLVAMLAKWNSTVNLVSKTSIDDAWSRHILDSAQIFRFGQGASHWVDMGSGGGFPGLVVSILATDKPRKMRLTLIESDLRKAAFLTQACHALKLDTQVLSSRIEDIPPIGADIVSARALAPLPQLCGLVKRHLAHNGTALLLKGKSYQTEVSEARQTWNFSLESHVSITDPTAVVLVLKEIAHA